MSDPGIDPVAPLTSADIEAMAAVGWEGDLEAMRAADGPFES